MIPDAIEVRLKPKERAELEARLRVATTEQRQLLRIRIVLEAAEGWSTREIARESLRCAADSVLDEMDYPSVTAR